MAAIAGSHPPGHTPDCFITHTARHHHAYELPPIVSELNGWLNDVEALIDEVRRLGRTG